MRVVLVDTNAVRAAEQAKAAALAQLGWAVTLVAPRGYRENYRALRAPRPAHPPYNLVLGQGAGKPPNRYLMLSGLGQALRSRPQAVVALGDENFWLTSQVVAWSRWFCPRALLVCHSWQNLDFDRRHHPQPSRLLYGLDTWLERRVFARVHGIMARNQEAMGVLRRRGYGGPVAHIPWAVEVERFAPAPPAGPRPYTIGYVGRLVEEKGVKDLLAASSLMKRPHRLVLVGDGPMRRELAGRDHPAPLELIPVVDHERMPLVYAALDVLALPSRDGLYWKEQFGRVLVEAMASRVAVVGSDSGAIPQVVGEAGAIFPQGRPAELARVLDALADPARREPLARAGRERALERFSWAAWARDTDRFVRGLGQAREARS